MVFGFLDIVSDFGILQLSPEFFEPEIKMIFNPVNINQAMITSDYELIGKFLQSMRLFGAVKTAENFGLITSCERFLFGRQSPAGSWLKPEGNVIYRFKATVDCAK